MYVDKDNKAYKCFPAPAGRFGEPQWPEFKQSKMFAWLCATGAQDRREDHPPPRPIHRRPRNFAVGDCHEAAGRAKGEQRWTKQKNAIWRSGTLRSRPNFSGSSRTARPSQSQGRAQAGRGIRQGAGVVDQVGSQPHQVWPAPDAGRAPVPLLESEEPHLRPAERSPERMGRKPESEGPGTARAGARQAQSWSSGVLGKNPIVTLVGL